MLSWTMTRNSADLSDRARELSFLFTSWPSVTGTEGEAKFAAKLEQKLRDLGFDDTWRQAIPGDALNRSNVFALKKGASRLLIILAGHFDTVPFDDYGAMPALSPLALRDALMEDLKATGASALALEDFETGDFLPGRGLLDMKSGIAAGIAAMEAYHGDASIMLVATPDEEDRSAGMRAAAPVLRQIAGENGLTIALVINLDAISDQGDGSAGRMAAMGSIGKQLIAALVIGQESHACYPHDGANAAYLAAELVREFELAPELAEQTGDEIAAPPTALHSKDLKQGYNVTTPAEAYVYWNTLQHRRSAKGVLEISIDLARRAMSRAEARLMRSIEVISFGDLNAVGDLPAQGSDYPERTKHLMREAWRRSGRPGLAVVMGFASIPYAAVSLQDIALRRLIAASVKPFGIGAISYFPGISDMSFMGEATGDSAFLLRNMPLARAGLALEEPTGLPCINIGPWGRDYHHRLERLHAPYAFETLPRVLLAVIDAVAQSR
jgi:arginine utilization protein RocB